MCSDMKFEKFLSMNGCRQLCTSMNMPMVHYDSLIADCITYKLKGIYDS